jgi:dTDP-4-dehydrorhamnose 3,5-epimerase-like enzyme
MSLIDIIKFQSLGDKRGNLIALEQNKEIPFDIKRIYYVFYTEKGVSRGFHAHKALRQVAVCVAGSCRFILDDGLKKEQVVLDKPNVGLVIDKGVWHEMHDFSDDCVLMVIASDHYNEDDYIRDYDAFTEHWRMQ